MFKQNLATTLLAIVCFAGSIATSLPGPAAALFILGVMLSLFTAYNLIDSSVKDSLEVLENTVTFAGTKIVALAGEKGSGKSTAAKIIVEKGGYYHTYFAKTLKHCCSKVFGYTDEQMEIQAEKEKKFDRPYVLNAFAIGRLVGHARPFFPNTITDDHVDKMIKAGEHRAIYRIREMLQFVGTELFRDCIHPDFHAMCVKKEIQGRMLLGEKKFVISDCRFDNERRFVKNVFKGELVLINDVEKPKEAQKDTHRSETGLGEFCEYDYIIANQKSIGVHSLENDLEVALNLSPF